MAEANIQELQNKFQTGTATESRDAITELLTLSGVDKNYASSFTITNYRFLSPELNAYGFTLDNAFIVFISRIYKGRKEILDYLLIPENWSIIHNAVVNKIITVEQLKGGEDEIDAPKLLFNPSFYRDIKQVDKLWVLQLWNWCASDEPDKTIRNEAVRLYLQGVKIDIYKMWKDYEKEHPERSFSSFILSRINKDASKLKKDLYTIERIRRAFLFTEDIVKVSKSFSEILDKVNKSKNIVKDNSLISQYNSYIDKLSKRINFVSSKLVPADIMSASVRACGENVVVSDKNDITGEYQDTQGKDNTDNNSNSKQNNITSRQNNITSRAQAQDVLNQYNVDISKLTFGRNAPRNAQQIGDAVAYMIANSRI